MITNLKVYDLAESLIASGYPMRTTLKDRHPDERDIKRALNLTKASNGNGAHGQWMTGVRVSFDVEFTNKAWVEAERYRFFEFVSSQSTMHRITKFDIEESYCEYVDPQVIEIMKNKVEEYNRLLENKETDPELLKKKYLEILYTNPAGFKIVARMTTNYRCLLNIWIQRHDHRLPEWREFCRELQDTLPYFNNLIIAYTKGEIKTDEIA